MRTYYVYIITNPSRTVFYTGITHNLKSRLLQHYDNRGQKETFAGRYYCFCLVYYESHTSRSSAWERERQIKSWRREKKISLIESQNPEWLMIYPQNLGENFL